MLKGVVSVEPGYAGSPKAEVIRVVYDPDAIAFPELLQVFFGSHDATQLNRQGADVGEQYRSVVFYTTERQREMTEHYIKMLGPNIVTRVEPLDQFYKAEDYHQKYYENNKGAGYCQLVIEPKIDKVRAKYGNLLK